MKTKLLNNSLSPVSYKNLNHSALRAMLVLMVTVLSTIEMWASGSATFYSTAGAQAVGNGKVYVGSTAATSSSSYATEMTAVSSKKESAVGSTPTLSNNIPFYYSAKADDGYVFLGWKKTKSDEAPYSSEETSFNETVTSSSKTEITTPPAFSAATNKYYAYFGTGKITVDKDVVAFDKTGSATFTVDYHTGGPITISSSSADFAVSPASIVAGKGSQTITITYRGSDEAIVRSVITIACEGVASQHVDASALTATITSANAASIVLQTGTVYNSSSHPYHPLRSLDFTGCFAGTAPLFDELYLFGKTLNKSNPTTTSLNINTAVTPCYVYTKSESSYVFSKVVNMNSDTKGIGVNMSSGKKYYFSGWCPYASLGYQSSDIGVFHVSGGAGAMVDIYLDNAQIYARTKFNGHGNYDFPANTGSGEYPSGSGGVFVFQTSSTNSSNPFKPSIHLMGDNFLSSQTGNYIVVSIAGNTRNATQCSAPIHMYTTKTSQYETLTIDDIWPVSSGTKRTNGALQLQKAVNQAPSIDLGNEKSVVNFNGGRITLQNAIPGSANYTTAFAISWRSYSQSIVTVYGLGNDQDGGTINFNDGTIDVIELTDAQYSANSTYYRDKKSIKCPSTVYINGGSFNCSIWKCTEPADLGASPTDKSGTEVCKLTIAQTGTEANGMAQYAIPAAFKPGLDAYYTEKGWTYGENSISADGEGNVNLMLPCDLIDESAIVNVEVTPWVGVLPAFRAGAIGQYVYFGGDQTIASDETHSTDRLIYARLDDYVNAEISSYSPPDIDGASVELTSPDYNKNALNETPYTITSNSYVLLPIVADKWFFFTAPFDITKVSVIDAYPDALVQADNNLNTSLSNQAVSNMDLFYYIGSSMQGGGQTSITTLINSWVNCQKTIRYEDKETSVKNQFKQREITPYTVEGAEVSKNNYWLYKNNANWTYNGKNFDGQTIVTAKNASNVWLEKGNVYSMMFPAITSANTGDWKYWTGKYILLEGGENCEIAGKNSQPATNESFTSTTTAAIKGNHTLADIPAPASVGAFWGYDYSTGTYKHQTSKTNPTQAFIYTSATPSDDTPAVLAAIRANGVCLYNITYSASTLLTLAAPEYRTYYVEGIPTTKYFYNSGAWKKLTYDGEKDLYLCAEDSHYYRYEESASLWVRADFTITWKNADNSTLRTDNNVLYGTTPSYGSVPTQAATAEYTYTFSNWTPTVGPVTADATYTATYNQTPCSYTLTWVTDGDALTGEYTSGTVAFGTTIVAPNTPTKTGFTFDGWTPVVAATMPAENTTYTATWAASIDDRELDIVDWTSNSVTINATNLKTAGGKNDWKVYVNGTDYDRTDCGAARTLTVSGLSLTPNENLLIQLKDGTGTVESRHNYKIPQIYTDNATLSGTTEESVVYVYGGKLTISGSTTLTALYVCPGAEVEVSEGTLTVGKLVLRTKPWQTAAISGSIVATNTYYTRIAPDGSVAYPTGQYYQFGLPYECAVSAVRLSDGTTPEYSTTWMLKSYNEQRRAESGTETNNWDVLASGGTIAAGRGYEMFSNYKYYREYYFPVTPTDNKSVAVTRHGEDDANSGWNIVCSPLMSSYSNTGADPVSGLKVSWLQEDGSYDQEIPATIAPAIPFSYQAGVAGALYFDGAPLAQRIAARRNNTAEQTETEWIHVDITDENEKGDHTSIFVHPDRFEPGYKTGIDVAKQSFEASRALLYSSHAYGDMAFAGVADSLLESGVALTVYSPAAQELTFSLRENEWLNRMEHVWLIDTEEGMRLDLLNGYYTFDASEGTTRGRFFIQGRFKAPDITTALEGPSDQVQSTKARKVLIDQKMYIIVNGQMFDATGKLVNKK